MTWQLKKPNPKVCVRACVRAVSVLRSLKRSVAQWSASRRWLGCARLRESRSRSVLTMCGAPAGREEVGTCAIL